MSVSNPVGGYPTSGLPGHYGNTTAVDLFAGNVSFPGNVSSMTAMSTASPSCSWDPVLGSTVCAAVQEVVTNATVTNATVLPSGEPLWITIPLGILAGCISMLTILGNILVLLGFGLERSIRQPTNYFLASLAVSDLLIGTFSMPLLTQYLLLGYWPLGTWLCDLWLSLDWTVCLTSQYTVFLITMDRFLSVKIPAKYRNWRTERKVLVMVAVTWILPMLVFFTSIIGWQYFVGERTVNEYACEVQFMSDPLFTFLLTLGYYWITLVVMCALYAGIYMVALNLQRKSDAKQKILKSAMELAADHAGLRNQVSNSSDSPVPKAKSNKKTPVENNKTAPGITKTTSFSKQKTKENDEDRSSSPAFASDDENSSSQGAGHGSSKTPLTSNNKSKRIKEKDGFINNALQPDSGKFHRSPVEFLLPTQMPGINLLAAPDVRVDFPSDIATDPSTNITDIDNINSAFADRTDRSSIPLLQNDIIKGSKYIDEKSFQSLNSENIKFLVDSAPNDSATEENEDQGSPVWRRRSSVDGGILVTIDEPSGPAPLQDKREFMLDDEVAADLQKGDNGTANNNNQTLSPENALEERGMQRLELAARKRRKNGRLQNLVKSVRSRNSRRRNRRERKSKSENRARKALRTITFILGAFVLCWTPYHIMLLVIAICGGYDCINLKFYNFTYWLCYLNSPINPFCYAFANAQFKRTFIRILKLDWHRT